MWFESVSSDFRLFSEEIEKGNAIYSNPNTSIIFTNNKPWNFLCLASITGYNLSKEKTTYFTKINFMKTGLVLRLLFQN